MVKGKTAANMLAQKLFGVSEGPVALTEENARVYVDLVEQHAATSFGDAKYLTSVIDAGTRLLNANMVDDQFLFTLMKANFASTLNLQNSNLVSNLLASGLRTDYAHSWKFLALLCEILHTVPQATKTIGNVIRSRYLDQVGIVLDGKLDFQQINFVVEILSNCYPKRSIQKHDIPQLWKQNTAKNLEFFNSNLYPVRGRHGDAQTLKFMLETLGEEFPQFAVLDNVRYGSNHPRAKSKSLKSITTPFCYIQFSFDKVYIWNGDGKFLIISRRCTSISRSLKNNMKITFQPNSKTQLDRIVSLNSEYASTFKNVPFLDIELHYPDKFNQFFSDVTHVRKISQVKTFLLLNHTEEEEPNDKVQSELSENISSSNIYSQAPRNNHYEEENNALVTPEKSDAKIGADEWDFTTTATLEAHKTPTIVPEKKNAQDVTNQYISLHSSLEEQSPLVLAQKRKMVRDSTRTLEILKKDFEKNVQEVGENAREDQNEPPPIPSLVITKYENVDKPTGNKGDERKKVASAQTHRKIKTPKKCHNVSSREISLLDTIFGNTSTSKRVKKKKELNNYKPIIAIPSQDVSTPAKKVESKNVSKLKSVKKKAKKPELETVVSATKKTNDKMNGEAIKLASKALNNQIKKPQHNQESQEGKQNAADIEDIVKPATTDHHNSILDSTTVFEPDTALTTTTVDNLFTNKLQEQIHNSISKFSNELVRKISIINTEINNKIIKELSQKYQNLFQQLQTSFEHDTEEMLQFMGEIKNMLNLPEDELIHTIRAKKIGRGTLPA